MSIDRQHASLRWTLRLEILRASGTAVIAAAGRLSAGTSGQMTDAAMQVLEGGDRSVVIDLAGVDYVSSAGLLAIEALATRFMLAGGELELCGLSDPVRLVFELAGLFQHVHVEPDRAAALARIARVPAAAHP